LIASFYIGWDVGGWNCDKNTTSRDALLILDADLSIVGTPWRGNLRSAINQASTTLDWLTALFALCKEEAPTESVHVTLAIDTPLGFSEPLVRLLTKQQHAGTIGESSSNPYLFRTTERFLFEHGLRPLSPIKDMIGSQATKGMHVLAKFASAVARCGVWTDGDYLTALEAYPSPCRASETVQGLLAKYSALDHPDKQDALICALIGYLFSESPEELAQPDGSVPTSEGWIWVPRDVL